MPRIASCTTSSARDFAAVFLACEQALYLAGIVKSGRARGTREETRRQGRGRERPLGPSRLRHSLVRSPAARFARPNRRACSQVTVLRDTFIISLYPPYVLGLYMRPNEFKYGSYRQSSAYFPRIHLWIIDKYSSTSFKQRLPAEFHGQER